MVNRSRTARRGMQPALALRPWRAPSISAPACREGRPPAARLTCARQLTRGRPRRGGAHVALRPEGDQRPAPRPVSNRRHGAPAPSSPSMRAARRSRAAWLRCRAPPVDRQHPAAPSRNPAPASTRPVDARLGPVRPASARRPASEPPSTRPHTPNRRLGALLWSAQPGSDPFGRRAAACRPPISARSGAIRPSTRPWAVHVAASPPVASRSSCPAAAYADPSGTPGTPTPAPRSVPGGGRDARAHICPRVRRGNFQKENQRAGPVPRASLDSQDWG